MPLYLLSLLLPFFTCASEDSSPYKKNKKKEIGKYGNTEIMFLLVKFVKLVDQDFPRMARITTNMNNNRNKG